MYFPMRKKPSLQVSRIVEPPFTTTFLIKAVTPLKISKIRCTEARDHLEHS